MSEISELIASYTVKQRMNVLTYIPDSNGAIFLRKLLDEQFPNGWKLSDVESLLVKAE